MSLVSARKWQAVRRAGVSSHRRRWRPLLARLRERYGALADSIASLGARHVLAMTNPYLTRRADGRTYCGDSPFNFERSFVPRLSTFFGFGISRAEGRNAEKVVLEPLNALISEEASRRGWTVVDGYRRDRGDLRQAGLVF